MDVVEVPKKQRPKKATRRRTNLHSRSNVLKRIKDCLEEGKYQHMLYWVDKTKGTFIIKFVHMNNPESRNADYLALFRELDQLSNSFVKYLLDKKYDHKCKIRCKANLRKLEKSGALEYMGKTWKGKSIQLRKYKLKLDAPREKNPVLKQEKVIGRSNVNGFNGCETVQGITYIKDKLKIENLTNEQSHYLCLSKNNPINICVSIPFGGTSLASGHQNIYPLPDIVPDFSKQFQAALKIGDTQETPQVAIEEQTVQKVTEDVNFRSEVKQGLLPVEQEENASHAVPIENPDPYSASTSCSSIESIMEIGNNGALSTSSAASLNLESVGKLLPNFINLIEEPARAINMADTNYPSSGYEDLLELSNNWHNGLQNEISQEIDGHLMDSGYDGMVPGSPQDFEGLNNDLLSHFGNDYNPEDKKLLAADPLWSDSSLDGLNGNMFAENEYPLANYEGSFSFENGDDLV